MFGCAKLRHKKYCILNKQYSKEEYYEMVEKVKKHMNEMPYVDKKGRVYKYGEFFPAELSPFGYNETLAHDFFPLEKEEAEQLLSQQERQYRESIMKKEHAAKLRSMEYEQKNKSVLATFLRLGN
jgi:hypothetical protein